MEVCSAPDQQRLTWLPNHQHYTFCNNLTIIAAPPGLLISTILFLQQSHCYCSLTWALVLSTGFKMDMLYATPWMLQIYHRSPHGHPAGQTQMLVIYHQPSQSHLVKRTVLVSFDSHAIALTLAASIICSAIIVR